MEKRMRELVLEYYNALVDLVDLDDDKKGDPFDVIEQAEVMHENEVSPALTEHLMYLRGAADAMDLTVIDMVHAAQRKQLGEGEMFDHMLDKMYKAPSFEDEALARAGLNAAESQYRELVETMWEKLSEEQRHAVYFAFMGKPYDSEEG